MIYSGLPETYFFSLTIYDADHYNAYYYYYVCLTAFSLFLWSYCPCHCPVNPASKQWRKCQCECVIVCLMCPYTLLNGCCTQRLELHAVKRLVVMLIDWNYRVETCLCACWKCSCSSSRWLPILSFRIFSINGNLSLMQLVHGQVTIIFVVSVCLSVCLCRVFLSRLWSDFDQTRTYVICLGLVVSPRIWGLCNPWGLGDP